MLEQKGIYAVLKNNLSLLEGLQFTPPSSARTKGDDTRYYVHTYLVRTPTYLFWFSVSWDIPTSAYINSRAYVQHFMIPGTCYVRDSYDTRYVLYRDLFIRAWVVRMRAWVVVRMTPTFRPTNSCIVGGTLLSPIQQQMHDQINFKEESYKLFSTGGAPRNHTNVPPVDAHVWRQLHLSAVARCSDSYCIFIFFHIPQEGRLFCLVSFVDGSTPIKWATRSQLARWYVFKKCGKAA